MADLAFVLRRTGPDTETHRVLLEAYQFSISNKLFPAARDFASRVVALAIDNHHYEVAEWMQRAIETFEYENEVHNAFSVSGYLCRIAIHENRLADAKKLAADALNRDWLTDRAGWLGASLALLIRINMQECADLAELRGQVMELHSLYKVIGGLGGQDYEVAALCSGLEYLGKADESRDILLDYLTRTRRDLIPYLPELGELADRLAQPSAF
jgi:hypothetical protein